MSLFVLFRPDLGLSFYSPIAPRHEPPVAAVELLWHAVDPVCSIGAAADHSKQRHPASGPQTVAGNRLIGIFRTGGQMAAMLPNQARQCKLICAHQECTQYAPRRLAPFAVEIPRTCFAQVRRLVVLPAGMSRLPARNRSRIVAPILMRLTNHLLNFRLQGLACYSTRNFPFCDTKIVSCALRLRLWLQILHRPGDCQRCVYDPHQSAG